MNTLFDELQEGLQEAIDYERGTGKAKKITYMISPIKTYSNIEIRKIRNKSGMTQKTFADFLGVSPKTVEAWETGRIHPTGPACRLISILESGHENKLDFISVKV